MRRTHFGLIFLCLTLGLAAEAEQVFIKNRPFKGLVTRADGKIWVELKPFAAALGWTLDGDEHRGYTLYQGSVQACPGAGKVAVAGIEVANRNLGATQVALEEVAPLVGAKIVENKELGTIDISLAKGKDQASADRPAAIGDAPYTLIEFSDPREQLCKDIQPAINEARAQFKNVQFVLCNVNDKSALKRFLEYKQVKDGSYPEVALVNSQGELLFQLRGNHVIAGKLLGEMRKKVK